MTKGILIFVSLITLSISMYVALALIEEPFSPKYFHVLPIFMTTINSILATFAVFYKLPARIILWVSLVIVLGGVGNFIYLTIEPGALQYGWLPYLIANITEPPFMIPLLLFNVWLPLVLWKTSKTPDPETSILSL